MNLVVNLYKEQSTIKGFEDSVRSLKDDIATHLKASPKKKDETMKELRSEIQKTAAAKLEGKILCASPSPAPHSALFIAFDVQDVEFYTLERHVVS